MDGSTMREDSKSNASWHRDPAWSGPRYRVFPEGGGELIAHEDGRWFVCVPGRYEVAAKGEEPTLEDAKARAIAVFKALTCPRR